MLLEDNKITDGGAKMLAAGIEGNKTIHTVYLCKRAEKM